MPDLLVPHLLGDLPLPDPTDRALATSSGWERRSPAPVLRLSEHYRHHIRNSGPLRAAAFRACSCDWVERPKPHRPRHAKTAPDAADKPRRRRASRVRAYVSHPGGDLAPLALAVRSWIALAGGPGPNGGSAVDGHGLGEVA